MTNQSTFLLILLAAESAIMVTVMLKTNHFVKSFLYSALSGIGALFAVNVLSVITGFTLGINYLTLLTGALGGIPGITALLIGRILILT